MSSPPEATEASTEASADGAHGGRIEAPSSQVRRQSGASSQCYMEAAAYDFGEHFAHRLRWAHAVNSRRRLRGALESGTHLLEADVSGGPLTSMPGDQNGNNESSVPLREALRQSQGQTSVRTVTDDAIIMAHYPTERSSDLSLECFVNAVLLYNESASSDSDEDEKQAYLNAQDEPGTARIASAFASSSSSSSSKPRCRRKRGAALDVGTDDEATAFANDLNDELEAQASVRRPLIPTCVGPRKRGGKKMCQDITISRKKGIKLDFKRWECVEPTINYLKKINAAERLDGHLWLNADVFAGPGSLTSPLDAQKFVRLCAEQLPQAVLSLGWGATQLSTTRRYTHEMIDCMVELCMCPMVKQPLTSSCKGRASSGNDEAAGGTTASSSIATSNGDKSDEAVYALVPPAAVSRHITYAVAAEYALASVKSLKRLLDTVPGSSLTIYTGVGSLGVTPETAKDLVIAFGKGRCFFDLWVTKPWRSWIFGSKSGAPVSEAEVVAGRGYVDSPINAAFRPLCGSQDARSGGSVSGEVIKII